ncbi:uncharacterized protein LOC142230396 [Haematobia irritans]|uniref:uncharacterized protein LOC142230396 n=1 Tax=Haematobia irritans TaxID=7368 RepID=UPI003F4FFDDF
MSYNKNRSYGMNPNSKNEPACDRLNKGRKSPILQNIGINGSRQNLKSKTLPRFQIIQQMAANPPQQQQNLLKNKQMECQWSEPRESPQHSVIATSGSNPNRIHRKYRQTTQPTIMPEMDRRGYFNPSRSSKLVKELLNARSLRNSKSSLDDNRSMEQQTNSSPHNTEEIIDTENYVTAVEMEEEEYLEESEEDYKLAPLMSSPSQCNLNRSQHILHNFQEVLQKRGETSLEPDEMEIVKNVIKVDKRSGYVDKKNPKLFKDILKSQLHDILKHEKVIKQALKKLDSKESIHEGDEKPQLQSYREMVNYCKRSEELKKLEVDVVFKNVPSLEREITILKALGEKLEATLNRTSRQRVIHFEDSGYEVFKPEQPLKMNSPKKKMARVKVFAFTLVLRDIPCSTAISLGVARSTGLAQEFSIAHKTIVELKKDPNKPFYIPLDPQKLDLKKTSFKELKENPDTLMKLIKAKNSSVSFNLLDQDPVFFNNILVHKRDFNKIAKNREEDDKQIERTPREFASPEKERQEPSQKSQKQDVLNCEKSKKPIQTLMLRERPHRRSIRRSITPFNMEKSMIGPKNNLLKTLLVGVVQISCFMLLIMAFTYPDAKC